MTTTTSRLAVTPFELAGESPDDAPARTWPGSHVYRELPGERCPHGILPAELCPGCCPGTRGVGNPHAVRDAFAEKMRDWHAARRAAYVPPADGLYRCVRCEREGRGPQPREAFYERPDSVRGVTCYCRRCHVRQQHEREQARGTTSHKKGVGRRRLGE